MYFRPTAEIGAHDEADELVRHILLKILPRPDVHLLEIGLAEARLAQHLTEVGEIEVMRVGCRSQSMLKLA
jgi:hypothetical protein